MAKQLRHSAKRRGYLSAGAVLLIAGIALGITTQPWRLLSAGKSRFSSRPVINPAPPTIPDVSHPSKEYIYGGGKLVATEAGKSDQTITFDSIPDKTFGDAAFSASALASSGLSVTFSVVSGPATISGSTVTITGVGTVTVRASQSGSENYHAATDVDRSFAVAKCSQTITLDSLGDKTYGDAPFSVTASSSSGLAVSLSVFSGPATISGSTVTVTGAGTVTIRASQGGDGDYNTATNVDQSFTVVKASQAITFSALADKTYGDAAFAVSASSSSGLAVSLFVFSGPATISGNTVTLTGAGTVTIRASQGGDGDYNAATNVDRSFTVVKASQAITFSALADKTYGDAAFAVSGSASSGLAVSFSIVSGPATVSGSTVTLTGAGTVTVRASQGGDGNYNAASDVDRSFTVAKASQAVTFNAVSDKTYGDVPFSLSGSSSSGLAVSFSIVSGPATVSGSTVTLTGAGSVTVRASQGGDGNYNAAGGVDRSFTVAKASQTVTFNAVSDKTYGDAPFSLSGSSSSGLAVSFSIVSGPATVSGSTVTLTGAGSVTVRASQGGDENYNAAADVDRSFTIAKASASITVSNLSQTYDGAPKNVTATTTPSGLNTVSITYDGSTTAPTNVGSYSVIAALTNNNYVAQNATGTLTINKASQTITFNALSDKTYGDAPFAISASSSSGLSVGFSITSGPATISNGTVTITGAGTVTVRASQSGNSSYLAATNVDRSFTVAKAAQTTTFDVLSNKTYGDSPFTVSASASSGLGVSFSILSGPVTISGNTITITGWGVVTVRASQAGNENYDAAPNVDRVFAVSRATPVITWNNPADIAQGTALSGTQLNATANVAGTFVYTPAAGTVLSVGNNQSLSLTFTPTDTTNYNGAGKTITINVIACPAVSGSSFSVNHSVIAAGTSVLLNWSVPNATSATISGVTGSFASSGTATVAPTTTTTYTLTANGSSPCSSISLNTTVTVAACPTAAGSSFSADSTSIVSGDSVTLSWNAPNATRVVIRGSGECGQANCNVQLVDGSSASGSITFAPQYTLTYTMQASAAYGCQTIEKQVVIEVAPIVGCSSQSYFGRNDDDESACLSQGDGVGLGWYIPSASGVGITDDLGNDYGYFFNRYQCLACGPSAARGNIFVAPATDTTYTLRADNGGAYMCTLTFEVHVCP